MLIIMLVIPFISGDLIQFLAVFAFVFALVFALLVYAKIFPESKKALGAISVVIGLLTAVYEPAVKFLVNVIPIAAIVLVFLFFIIFIKKLFEKKDKPIDLWPAMLGLGIMLILINVFWDKISGYIGFSSIPGDTVLWLIGILVIIIILLMAYMEWS